MKSSLLRVLILFLVCVLTTKGFAQVVVSSPSSPGGVIKGEEQMAKTTEGPNNIAFRNANILTKDLSCQEQAKGLQVKDPVVAPSLDYQWTDDSSSGGFSGHEVSGSVALDADVWNGLILGVLYLHTHRDAESSFGISQHLDSDGVSLYAGKRFLDLLNVGLAYNYANTRDRLSRAIEYNMNRESNGGTAFVGLSDRKGKWSWSSTAGVVYVSDDYDSSLIKDRTTSRLGFTNTLAYDVTKVFTLGAAGSYYNFFQQDLYTGISARDDDYWVVGPRFTFYPSEQLTVHFDFDSQQGYKDLTAYLFHVGVDISF